MKKKITLSNEQIHQLMNVYDFETACAIEESLGREFKTLHYLVYQPEFVSINHVIYFELMFYDFTRFPEFEGIFDQLYYGIEDEIWIAPETVDFSEYALNPDIKLDTIPEAIRSQLRPLTRDDVLAIAEQIKEALMELSSKFNDNVIWWLEDDDLTPKDIEKKYKLKCFEYVLDGAFDSYFDRLGEFFVPGNWSMLQYLCYCWENEDPENYKQLENMYLKFTDEVNKREEKYNNAFLEWEEFFSERMRFEPDDIPSNQEINSEIAFNKVYYDYLRNHVFNCVSEETLTDFFNK